MSSIPSRPTFRRRHVLVVGLGLHGGAASAIRWFARQGAQLRVQDIKTRAALAPTLKKLRGIPAVYHFGGHPAADFRWAEAIYVNQGVPLDLPPLVQAQRQGIPILNETSLFFEYCPGPIVGVTGTRGKSTTTVLLHQVLEAARRQPIVSGNLRQNMMLDVLPRLRPTDLAVVELSSFQLEYLPSVRRSPQVAIMTNLKVDHLNRYASMDQYADAKYNIFRWQHPHDIAVLNADNQWTKRAAGLTPAAIWWFQLRGRQGQHGITTSAGWIIEYHAGRSQRLFRVADIRLSGVHNHENVLAVVAAARAMNVPVKVIQVVVKKYAGIPHRQEVVRRWRQHLFVNDTTATTPDGTLAALKVFPRATFIIGGADKQLDFTDLVQQLRRHPSLVFLPGTATEKILKGLRRAGDRREFHPVSSMHAAVHQALALAKPKQTIVLSPGAASFGLFVHEFDRGDQFRRVVQRLT